MVEHRFTHRFMQSVRELSGKRRIWLTALGVASSIICLKVFGVFQATELSALDQMFQLRPIEVSDPRIVIVNLDEDDIHKLKTYPVSDQVMANLLKKIKAHNPRVIGLDIYRDLPYLPGQNELEEVFRETPNLIGIEKIGDNNSLGVVAHPLLEQRNQVGFNNIVLDPDGHVRRNLLYWIIGQKSKVSFALKTALAYLEEEGITAKSSASNALQLGPAIFPKLQPRDGGYAQIDNGGYQILADFRHYKYFKSVSFTDVLSGEVPLDFMTDRIVLIGATAPSLKDSFATSYTSQWTMEGRQSISGVELHAHIISQILSSALDNRASLRVWPEGLEYIWIIMWSLVGATLSWRVRSPLKSGGLLLGTGAGLFGICYLAFVGGWWIPVVPPVVAMGVSAIAIISYIAHCEGELQKTKEFLNSIINSIPDPIFVKDTNQRWMVVNEAYCQFLGRQRDELLDKTEADVLPPYQAVSFREQDDLTFATQAYQESEGELTNANGYTYNVAMKRSLHKDGAGNVFLVGVIHDITHRKRMEEELRRTAAQLVQSNAELRQAGDAWRKIAYHDPLTGLPNRQLFQERLIQSIEWGATNQQMVALLFLDLDGFKAINDTEGHVVGDLLLKAVAQRLTGCLRGSDTIARLGGDEFVVILPGIPGTQVGRVAEKILTTLAQTFTIQSKHVSVTTSIGISIYPLDGKDFDVLIVEADQAMYRSKESGRNQYTFAHHHPSLLGVNDEDKQEEEAIA